MSPAQATARPPINRAAPTLDAPGILRTAADTIDQRGAERDTHGDADAPQERSMACVVAAFNAMHPHARLTEREGWVFMTLLKLGRAAATAANGRVNPDDYVDGAAYVALAGESVCTAPAPIEPGA